jgi:hypothetical protein
LATDVLLFIFLYFCVSLKFRNEVLQAPSQHPLISNPPLFNELPYLITVFINLVSHQDNGSIRFGLNYSVINETKQNK